MGAAPPHGGWGAGAGLGSAGLPGPGTTIGDLSGAGAIALGAKTLTFGTGGMLAR